MKYLKSKTVVSAIFIAATQFPALSNPIWAALVETGLSFEVVAQIKTASFLIGFAGVIYGRAVAKGPL